jgi:sec-independent protein translocase protein TatA
MYSGVLVEFLNMGGGEIMLIMVVVLLLFGGKKLPELARGLGKGIRDFKDASEGVKREIHRNINSMDIDEEVNRPTAAASYAPEKTSAELLEEQMYPKTTVNEPINLNKEVPADADRLETEKNKI